MDSTFPWRLAGGLSLLGWLVVRDLRKPNPTYVRLKEYGFLFGTVILAIAYGLVHDVVTYAISREYYVVGKGLESAADGFNRDVAMLAAQASWSVGLLVGIVFLVANRPHPHLRQLPYSTLAKVLALPLTGSMLCAGALAPLGFLLSTPISNRFELHYLELHSPARFCTTWGIHVGTYVGAITGVAIAVLQIRNLRRLQ